ncbi:hypothetical protein ACQJBY_009432 [Aegilops geniculata]
MSMDFVETKGSWNYFRYAYDSSVSHVQELFEAAESANDLNAIAVIVEKYPYHPDSLLTFADKFKYSGEHHSSVQIVTSQQYKWTLLSANRHFSVQIDTSQQYKWLEKFAEEYQSDNSLWLFPNFSFSVAIAWFYLERDVASEDVFGHADKSTVVELLKQALMLHPLVLSKMVDNAPLKDSSSNQILKTVFCSSQHGRFTGGAIENNQKIGIELGGLNTTKHTYEEHCNFLHQLVISSTIVTKHILRPYDPGGLVLRLGECGGFPDSRMLLVGLRASQVSREEECNTPPMGCHPILRNRAWAMRWAVHWRFVHTRHSLHMQPGEHMEWQRMNESSSTFSSSALVPLLQLLLRRFRLQQTGAAQKKAAAAGDLEGCSPAEVTRGGTNGSLMAATCSPRCSDSEAKRLTSGAAQQTTTRIGAVTIVDRRYDPDQSSSAGGGSDITTGSL